MRVDFEFQQKGIGKVYLEGRTCNLGLVFQVLCHLKRKNHLDIACSAWLRVLHRQSNNHLK